MKKRNLVLFGTVATLSLALAGSIGAVTASATDLTPEGSNSGSVTITYQQDDAWKVTIPNSMEIGTAAEVKATDVSIENGTTLKVTVSSTNYDNGWKLKNGDKSIDYTLKAAANEDGLGSASALTNNGEVLTVASGNTEGTASIKGEVEGNPSTGGNEYSDTLTFQVDVE